MIPAVVIVLALVAVLIVFARFVRATIRNESKALTDQIDACVKAVAGILKVKFEGIQHRLEALEKDAG